MGVVYRGYDPLIGRKVAIKRMLTEGLRPAEYKEYKARFQREAQSAGVLTHPNIVTIYDFGEDQEMLYLAMEYLEGKTLHAVIEEHGSLPIEKIVPMFEEICGALDHAHSFKIVHRDIKPANIMVLESGHIKITDFGIAKVMTTGMTQTGQILGTPNYMSPEQVTGKGVDGRSDLFSVGVILYELVTGAKPFGGENITTVIYKIVHENPVPPIELDSSIHPGLNYVISKALNKIPEDRYQTCSALAEDLKQFRNLGVAAEPSATVALNAPPSRRPSAPSTTPRPRPSTNPPQGSAPRSSAPAPRPPTAASAPEPTQSSGSRITVPPPLAPRPPVSAPPARPDVILQPAAAASKRAPQKPRSMPVLLLGALIAIAVAGGAYYERTPLDHLLLSLLNRQTNGAAQQPPAPAPAASTAQPPASNASSAAQAPAPSANAPSGSAAGSPGAVAGAPASSAASQTTSPSGTAAPAPIAAPATQTTSTKAQKQPTASPLFGRLTVSANVRDAAISVDGHTHSDWRTPHIFQQLTPGRHTITLTKDGYRPVSRRVTVQGGRGSRIELALRERALAPGSAEETAQSPAGGSLEPATVTGETIIVTKPKGVEVEVGGKSYGPSPARVNLPPGRYKCILNPRGAQPHEEWIDVKANVVAVVTFTLETSAMSEGTLDIHTIPEGATIMVDGAMESAQTPAKILLGAGEHTITLSVSGFPPQQKRVDVKPGRSVPVDVVFGQ